MKVLSKPHLPYDKVELFLVDKRAKNIKLNNIVQSFEHNNLLEGINTHPDMTFCPLEDGVCVVAKESYDYYKAFLSEYGYKVIMGESDISKDYPYDILYNCVILNNKLFHNLKYTDNAILNYCKEKNYKLIDVKQGYTKCSTLIVDENSVITCDRKLNEIYIENGIDSLYVDNKTIRINGFDHGFIGGCGGKISKNELAFFGDITRHPDFLKIDEFLKSKNVKWVLLNNESIFDYGSLIPLVHI